jgi:hypothetical protein
MSSGKVKKQWQRSNKDKVHQYQRNYMKDKTQASVVLEAWVKEQIDAVKDPDQTYGNWLRSLAENWARQQQISDDT